MAVLETEGRRQTVTQYKEIDQARLAAARLLGREAAAARLAGEAAPEEVWGNPDALGYMLEYERMAMMDAALGPKGRALMEAKGIRDPRSRAAAVRWVNGQ